ncbi:MAG: GNAT family N-acetyltransferase [Flavobacteriaceae bacterium]
MENFYTLKTISAEQAYTVRHPVLRPNRPFSSCIFEYDTHAETLHLGAFFGGELVGVLSAMPTNCPDIKTERGIQFRGMAVLETHQRKGVGTQMLNELMKRIQAQNKWDYFWLNARINAILVYLRIGMQPLGAPFDIPLIGPHQRLYKKL